MMHLDATRHARERGWIWMQGEQHLVVHLADRVTVH